MDIEFSIKSKKFYEFLCVFNPADAEANRNRFYSTDYIKVNISYELDDNNKILLNQFKISKDTEEKNVPVFIYFPLELQKIMVEKSSSKSYIPFLGNICANENTDRQHIVAYIGLDICGNIQITDDIWSLGIDKARPATKEQRNLLFAKMKEAGYEWDAEKKELRKIEDKK